MNLDHFTGTEAYHRISPFKHVIATDGIAYLAKEAQAYWLIYQLAVMLLEIDLDKEYFVFFNLLTDETGMLITTTDGNENQLLAPWKATYTDFPIGRQSIYATWDEYHAAWVLMLPSEY